MCISLPIIIIIYQYLCNDIIIDNHIIIVVGCHFSNLHGTCSNFLILLGVLEGTIVASAFAIYKSLQDMAIMGETW